MLEVNRRELKYALDPVTAAKLRSRLGRLMEPDPHNGPGGYRVRSLYFDTPEDSDFEEKVDGYDARQKIRLRIYDVDTGIIKLELKEKAGGVQRKSSLFLSRDEAERMMRAEYSFLAGREEPLARRLCVSMMRRCYRPKCMVEYDRFAYLLRHNDTRVTFDGNLRASECGFDFFGRSAAMYPVCRQDEITMEIKYNGFFMTFLKNELNACDRIPLSNSKYCRARMVSKSGRR